MNPERKNQNSSQDLRLFTVILGLLFLCTPFFPQRTNAGFTFLFHSVIYLMLAGLVLRNGWSWLFLQIKHLPFFLPAILFLLFCLAGLFYTADPYSAKAKCNLLLSGFLLFVLCYSLPAPRSYQRFLLWCLVLGSGFAAGEALYLQWAGHGDLIQTLKSTSIYEEEMRNEMIRSLEANRAMGHFGNPNHLAGYLILSLWPLWLLWKESRSKQIKSGLLFLLIPILAATYQTFSRSGIVVLFFSFAAIILFELNRRDEWKWLRNLILTSGLILIFSIPLFLSFAPANFLGGRLKTTSTVVARIHFFRGAVLVMKEYPWLGVGPEGFETSYCKYIRPGDLESKYVHNIFLEAGTEGGIPGLLFLLWLLAAGSKALWRWWKENMIPKELLFASYGAAAGFLLFSSFDFHNNQMEMYLAPLVLIGQCGSPGGSPSNEKKNINTTIATMIQWGFRLVGVVLFCTWVLLVVCRYYNQTERDLAYGLLLEKKYPDAQVTYEKAVWYDCMDANSWGGLGRVWQNNSSPDGQLQALFCYEQAVRRAPKSASAHADYAAALFGLGYPQKAILELQTAQRLFPAKPRYYEQMADIYRALGDETKAKEQTETAQKIKKIIAERKI